MQQTQPAAPQTPLEFAKDFIKKPVVRVGIAFSLAGSFLAGYFQQDIKTAWENIEPVPSAPYDCAGIGGRASVRYSDKGLEMSAAMPDGAQAYHSFNVAGERDLVRGARAFCRGKLDLPPIQEALSGADYGCRSVFGTATMVQIGEKAWRITAQDSPDQAVYTLDSELPQPVIRSILFRYCTGTMPIQQTPQPTY